MDSAACLEVLRRRIQAEYREMPGLKLTLWQAGRLWNEPYAVCQAALASLVRSGFLREAKDGHFLRAS
jgi:hypothetical protein